MPETIPITNAILTIVPEAMLLGAVCLMLLVGPFLVDETGKAEEGVGRRWTILSMLTMAIAGWVFMKMSNRPPAANGPFVADGLAFFVRMLTFTLGPVLLIILTRQIDDGSSAEAHACLLTMLAGTNLVALSTDLVGLFLSLELISIPTYIYLYLPRRDAMMQEAALKYFLLSVFSSGFVLFGMSWLYGAAGTTKFNEMSALWNAPATLTAPASPGEPASASGSADATATVTPARSPLLLPALAILIAGLSFRLAAVPFHFYAPDVFQGVNSASASMLSLLPKVAGFAALFRVLPNGAEWLAHQASEISIQHVLAVLAVATMTLGNLLALRQHNLHRLLAYSSIAHSGYMLVGLAMGPTPSTVGGVTALWFYLATYGLVTVGVFALLAAASDERPLPNDADLIGLSQSHPAIAVLLAVSLFSLTGLPPTAGFWGKLNLFSASWTSPSAWGLWLAGAIAVNAAIAAWYYLRLIAAMYREPAAAVAPTRLALAPAAAGGTCAIASILIFAAPQRLLDFAALISR
jgi:NADH-quinone oxidoreductase subunit N